MTKEALTQEQVENFIQLKSQGGKRWFEMRFLDEDMQNDATAQAFMETLSDVIFDGMINAIMNERMTEADTEKNYIRN